MGRASPISASTGYREYVGSGQAIASPGPTKVRTAMARMSSLPLPAMIWSRPTRCRRAASSRKASAVALGYLRRNSGSNERMASMTRGLGG